MLVSVGAMIESLGRVVRGLGVYLLFYAQHLLDSLFLFFLEDAKAAK